MLSLESLTIYGCDELEHIVVDIGDGSGGNELGINVFPKLKELNVEDCEKLEYIFGHINASNDNDQNNNEIQLHLPALKSLELSRLESLIGLCPKRYHTTFPPLKVLELRYCSQDSTTFKQFSGNMEHFLALEDLKVSGSNVESILCLNEESEREINLGLQLIALVNLPMMIYLFEGPKNAFLLKNLKRIAISRCEKLEIVFSTSILRCLSQLSHLKIEECNELKHIIEEDDDIENQGISNCMSSKTYFPVLKILAVVKCNKLKSVFPISMSKELPELNFMFIGEANELKEIFKGVGGDDQKVEIPNLKAVAFVNLPSLCHVQGIQFQIVENCVVHNCKKLPLTSITSSRDFRDDAFEIDGIDFGVRIDLIILFGQLQDMMTSSQKEMNQTPEAENEFIENHVPDLEIPSVATPPTNSEELISERSTSQQHQHSHGEIDTTIKLSQCVILQIAIPFSVSTTKCLNIEDVNLGDSHKTTQTNNPVSLNDDAFLQVSSTIQQQFPKDDEIIVSGLGMPSAINSPTNSQGIKISVEDDTTSANAKTITSSTHSKSVSSSSGLSTSSKSETSSPIKMKQTPEAMHKLVENVPDLEIPSLALLATNSEELMDQQSMDKKCSVNPQHSLGEVDTTTKPSQGHNEDGDGKISIPSFSTVNTKPPATKYQDIGDSQETIAMEDINKLIEEDPLLALVALEKLLTGQVSISSVRVLLQELKTLMDSSDLDHLVSNQESISKLNSLFHRLNQHQGMLTSDVKDFVVKVQNFFNENIIKHATSQQVLKKHNQLLDSKTDLMNKLWSVKSTQTHIDSETSTTNTQIHELSLQIDELRKKLADLENQRDSLKSVADKCHVQKMKLKPECTELAEQSKKFFSSLASSEVDLREAEHARNLAKEGFANLKSSFPRF
ncbi:hypothetical protein TSUD_124940 [Trifolium subterraneum]|uniref:Disease resistance protein At4g27190-like leucine-rich repeats domain-containing protein n=1 Tax=Trifolium subterraneum TaxID=3900 RepID=A0A2Z6LQL2_TRISU|nr:hypothetical protein TSUD_124940 [Trifolium subterraneum]